MLSLEEYCSYDGLGLAGLVEEGKVSPAELIDAAARAIERVNPQLNAVLQVLVERATAEVAEAPPSGPFCGVPFLLKELMCHAAHVPINMGSRLAEGVSMPHETELMARFRRAGLVTVGTTQTPELGYNPTTEPLLYGPVRNPWNPEHSAGGSSGGSGAAVAAGIAPLAHANDGGGSIRIPAACNGLVGLKPSRDRVPTGPDFADPLCGFAVEFAVTRSVRDAAVLLDAVAGPDVGAPSAIAPPKRPFGDEVGAGVERLRVAWSSRGYSEGVVDPACQEAVRKTVSALEGMGHELVEALPPLEWESFQRHNHTIWTAYVAHTVEGLERVTKRKASLENLEAVTWSCYQDGKRVSACDLLAALDYLNQVSRQTGTFFENHDVLLTPTMAREPARLGEYDQNDPEISAWEWTDRLFRYIDFTPICNVTGQPAISLPMHKSPTGLPIGVQFAGRSGEEATLLRLASELEMADLFNGGRPAIHAAGS